MTMCARYLSEDALISAMARWLRSLPSLTDNVAVVISLRDAGFAPRDIRDHREAAITYEMKRRLAFDRRFA